MLPHLIRKTLRSVAWVALVAVLVGIMSSGVRLLPWLVARDVPWAVSVVFLKALLLASTAVGLAVALPLGVGIEVERWCHDGTLAALRSLGVGPLRVAGNAVPVCALAGGMVIAISYQAWKVEAQPGQFSNNLLHAASAEACASGNPQRVPLMQATWLCMGGTPVLVGRHPAEGPPQVVWKAAQARFSPRLDRVELAQATLVAPSPKGGTTEVRAGEVVLSGFLPWLVPTSVPPSLRAAAAGLSCVLSAVATAWVLLVWPVASKARAVAVACGGLLVYFLLAETALERVSWLGVGLLGVAVAGCCVAVGRATSGFPATDWMRGR